VTTAKFSRSLIRRIYDHAFAEGWLESGMTALDPFAGVCLGATDATWRGLNWVGVELEPKFVALGQQNLDLWRRKYGSKEGFGSARIIQGDSRKLAEVITGADLICSSLPYASGEKGHPSLGSVNNDAWGTDGRDITRRRGKTGEYGETPGQLGAMKEGDFDCVVGSPPFMENNVNIGAVGNTPSRRQQIHDSSQRKDSYGSTEGQLASLPEGRFEAVISSPPYEGSVNAQSHGIDWAKVGPSTGNRRRGPGTKHEETLRAQLAYGNAEGQLGCESGDTFWSSAREILIQCHTILRLGGHCIWVTKRFVRAGKIVEFSDQWQALCESVGFQLVCRHRAMLVKNHGQQETIFNGTEQIKTERKSFFRRLAERKGSPRIDWEDVLCFERVARGELILDG